MSKRVAQFKSEIIQQLPRFPNTKESKEILEKASLGELFIHYINWRSRFIGQRPRVAHVQASAANDPRWEKLKPGITFLLEKAKRGDDLTPHLSRKTRKGFTPAARGQGPDVDRWADKDFLLHVMGYHHFHLGTKIGKKGFVTPGNDELFAAVSREYFDVIGIFNHSVFKSDTNAMSVERERLWDLFLAHKTRGNPSGSAVLLSDIATSAHTMRTVSMAGDYAEKVQQWDPRLDDPAFVAQALFASTEIPLPSKPKLSWRFTHLDLGVYDEASDVFFSLYNGPN